MADQPATTQLEQPLAGSTADPMELLARRFTAVLDLTLLITGDAIVIAVWLGLYFGLAKLSAFVTSVGVNAWAAKTFSSVSSLILLLIASLYILGDLCEAARKLWHLIKASPNQVPESEDE